MNDQSEIAQNQKQKEKRFIQQSIIQSLQIKGDDDHHLIGNNNQTIEEIENDQSQENYINQIQKEKYKFPKFQEIFQVKENPFIKDIQGKQKLMGISQIQQQQSDNLSYNHPFSKQGIKTLVQQNFKPQYQKELIRIIDIVKCDKTFTAHELGHPEKLLQNKQNLTDLVKYLCQGRDLHNNFIGNEYWQNQYLYQQFAEYILSRNLAKLQDLNNVFTMFLAINCFSDMEQKQLHHKYQQKSSRIHDTPQNKTKDKNNKQSNFSLQSDALNKKQDEKDEEKQLIELQQINLNNNIKTHFGDLNQNQINNTLSIIEILYENSILDYPLDPEGEANFLGILHETNQAIFDYFKYVQKEKRKYDQYNYYEMFSDLLNLQRLEYYDRQCKEKLVKVDGKVIVKGDIQLRKINKARVNNYQENLMSTQNQIVDLTIKEPTKVRYPLSFVQTKQNFKIKFEQMDNTIQDEFLQDVSIGVYYTYRDNPECKMIKLVDFSNQEDNLKKSNYQVAIRNNDILDMKVEINKKSLISVHIQNQNQTQNPQNNLILEKNLPLKQIMLQQDKYYCNDPGRPKQFYIVIKIGSNSIQATFQNNKKRNIFIATELLKFLIKKKKITEQVLVNQSLFSDIIEQINYEKYDSLVNENCMFIEVANSLLSKQYFSKCIHIKNINSITNLLKHKFTFCAGIYLIKKLSTKQTLYNQRVLISDEFENMLSSENHDTLFEALEISTSPIVTLLTVSSILFKYTQGQQNPKSPQFLAVAEQYRDLAIQVTQDTQDRRIFKRIIFTKTFPCMKTSIVDMLEKYKDFYESFLTIDNIKDAIYDKWNCTYDYDANFMTPSTSYSILFEPGRHFQKNEKEIIQKNKLKVYLEKTIFSKVKFSNKLSVFQYPQTNHIYQLFIYKKSPAVSRMVSFFYYLVMLVVFIWYLQVIYLNPRVLFSEIDYSTTSFILYGVKPELETNKVPTWNCGTEEQTLENYNQLKDQGEIIMYYKDYFGDKDVSDYSFNKECKNILSKLSCQTQAYYQDDEIIQNCQNFYKVQANIENGYKNYGVLAIPFTFMIQTLLDKINKIERNIKYKVFNYINIFDIANLIIFICTIIIGACEFSLYQKDEDLYPKLFKLFEPGNQDLFNYYQDWFLYTMICGCIILFCYWVKLYEYLEKTQIMGTLLKMIEQMIQDLTGFLILLLIFLNCFATVFYVLYKNKIDSYNDGYFITIRKLFEGSIGNFDYDSHTLIPTIFLTVFLFLTLIILFNVLIAILTSTYEKTQMRSNMEYSITLYRDFGNLNLNYRNYLLVGLPAPCNAFSGLYYIVYYILYALTFYMSTNAHSRVQRYRIRGYIFILGHFIFIVLPFYSFFLAFNIILIPFSYLYVFGKIIKNSITSIKNHRTFIGQQTHVNRKLTKAENQIIRIVLLQIVDLVLWLLFGLIFYIVALFNDTFVFFSTTYRKTYGTGQMKKSFGNKILHNFKSLSIYSQLKNKNKQNINSFEGNLLYIDENQNTYLQILKDVLFAEKLSKNRKDLFKKNSFQQSYEVLHLYNAELSQLKDYYKLHCDKDTLKQKYEEDHVSIEKIKTFLYDYPFLEKDFYLKMIPSLMSRYMCQFSFAKGLYEKGITIRGKSKNMMFIKKSEFSQENNQNSKNQKSFLGLAYPCLSQDFQYQFSFKVDLKSKKEENSNSAIGFFITTLEQKEGQDPNRNCTINSKQFLKTNWNIQDTKNIYKSCCVNKFRSKKEFNGEKNMFATISTLENQQLFNAFGDCIIYVDIKYNKDSLEILFQNVKLKKTKFFKVKLNQQLLKQKIVQVFPCVILNNYLDTVTINPGRKILLDQEQVEQQAKLLKRFDPIRHQFQVNSKSFLKAKFIDFGNYIITGNSEKILGKELGKVKHNPYLNTILQQSIEKNDKFNYIIDSYVVNTKLTAIAQRNTKNYNQKLSRNINLVRDRYALQETFRKRKEELQENEVIQDLYEDNIEQENLKKSKSIDLDNIRKVQTLQVRQDSGKFKKE